VYSLNPALAALEGDADDTSPASPQRARAEICSIAELYSQRYLDAFGDFVPAFVKGVWEMLGNEAVCGKGEKYDLVSWLEAPHANRRRVRHTPMCCADR
jgi:hypothetical protein